MCFVIVFSFCGSHNQINVSLGTIILGNAHLRDVKTHLNNDLMVYTQLCSVNAILSRPKPLPLYFASSKLKAIDPSQWVFRKCIPGWNFTLSEFMGPRFSTYFSRLPHCKTVHVEKCPENCPTFEHTNDTSQIILLFTWSSQRDYKLLDDSDHVPYIWESLPLGL